MMRLRLRAQPKGVRGEINAATRDVTPVRIPVELDAGPPVLSEPEPVDVFALRLQEQDLRIVLWRDGLLPAPWVALAGHELEDATSRLQSERERMAGWPVVSRPATLGEQVVTEAEAAKFQLRLRSLGELRRVRQRLVAVA